MGKTERCSVSMVCLKGVTVATRKQLARQTCCVILFAAFPPFFYPSVLILPSLPLCPASYLSLSRDLFLHFSPHFAFSCLLSLSHTPALSNLSPFFRHPHGYTLFEINFVGVLTTPPPLASHSVCVSRWTWEWFTSPPWCSPRSSSPSSWWRKLSGTFSSFAGSTAIKEWSKHNHAT